MEDLKAQSLTKILRVKHQFQSCNSVQLDKLERDICCCAGGGLLQHALLLGLDVHHHHLDVHNLLVHKGALLVQEHLRALVTHTWSSAMAAAYWA